MSDYEMPEGAEPAGVNQDRLPPTTRRRYRDELLKRRIQAGEIAVGPGYLYRPNEILVNAQDLDLLTPRLRMFGVRMEPVSEVHEVTHLQVDSEHSVPELLAILRHRDPESGLVPLVAPNLILTGAGNVMGNAGGPVAFAEPAEPPMDATPGEPGRITVDARDTLPPEGHLDDEAGHGTFCAGVVLQTAPNARVAIHHVLDSEGFATEIAVRDALVELVEKERPDILSLSFGAFTDNDAPLLALGAAISALPPEIVVVAAAGNQGLSKPFWPAAQKRVIGVGALDSGTYSGAGGQASDQTPPAAYSNFGWWVDAWAIGDRVSTFFLEWDDSVLLLPGGVALEARHFEGWARWSGTSFATPAVAGAIAALAQRDGIDVRGAAFRLIQAVGVPRVPVTKGSGAIVG
ncbi:MAG: S8/S53 family peptidase [Actinobacteria bacterium]|nr:MAG: S8/S53 family peptidase [Actinomycetota bacterium]